MNIEDRIRSRIDAILLNDARNCAELRQMATDDEPLMADSFEEERNLYQRIINNYRNAVTEVNRLLEENVGFLSGFYRVIEGIKEKSRFEEISTHIADSMLQDFGAEYCSIVLNRGPDSELEPFCLEGMCEERKILRMHCSADLLGSPEFERVVGSTTGQSACVLNIGDVYRDARFNSVDFPSIVRALVYLPITHGQQAIGAIVLGHSQPHFFTDNHLRVLKILVSMVSHLCLLTRQAPGAMAQSEPTLADGKGEEAGEAFSIALLDFERVNNFGRPAPPDKKTMHLVRSQLHRSLGPHDSILLNGEGKLLVMLPGVGKNALPARVCSLRDAFFRCRNEHAGSLSGARMSIGFATCEEDDDLSRTLEMAALFIHSETDAELDLAAQM